MPFSARRMMGRYRHAKIKARKEANVIPVAPASCQLGLNLWIWSHTRILPAKEIEEEVVIVYSPVRREREILGV